MMAAAVASSTSSRSKASSTVRPATSAPLCASRATGLDGVTAAASSDPSLNCASNGIFATSLRKRKLSGIVRVSSGQSLTLKAVAWIGNALTTAPIVGWAR